jgi:DNA-binding MarR family transcriptional regulator
VLAGEHAQFVVREEFEAAGVEVYVWGLLVHVAAGSATPSQLAVETGTTHSTIRDQVQSLVDRDLLRRVPNPLDRRSYRLELTDRGRASVDRGLAASARARERIEAELGGPLEPLRQELLELTRAASRARG